MRSIVVDLIGPSRPSVAKLFLKKRQSRAPDSVFPLKNGVADRSRSVPALAVDGRRKGSVFCHSRRFQTVFAKGLHVEVIGSEGDRGFDPRRASLVKEIGLQISSGPRLLLMIKGDDLIEGAHTSDQIKLQKERSSLVLATEVLMLYK